MLVVDQSLIGTCSKLVFFHTERVENTRVASAHHFGGHRRGKGFVIDPVDELSGFILDIALTNQDGLAGIVQVGDTDGCIGQLIDLITFEMIFTLILRECVMSGHGNNGFRHDRVGSTISVIGVNRIMCAHKSCSGKRLGNLGIQLLVGLMVVVAVLVLIGDVQNQLIFELTNGDVGSIRTIQGLKAVFEEGLALVIGQFQQLDRGLCTTLGSTCPRNTHRDVVDRTRLQGERTSGLHETTVIRSVAHVGFSPAIGTIL